MADLDNPKYAKDGVIALGIDAEKEINAAEGLPRAMTEGEKSLAENSDGARFSTTNGKEFAWSRNGDISDMLRNERSVTDDILERNAYAKYLEYISNAIETIDPLFDNSNKADDPYFNYSFGNLRKVAHRVPNIQGDGYMTIDLTCLPDDRDSWDLQAPYIALRKSADNDMSDVKAYLILKNIPIEMKRMQDTCSLVMFAYPEGMLTTRNCFDAIEKRVILTSSKEIPIDDVYISDAEYEYFGSGNAQSEGTDISETNIVNQVRRSRVWR